MLNGKKAGGNCICPDGEKATRSIWKGLCYSGNPILEAAFIDAGALYFILRNSRGVTPVAFLNMAIKWLASVNPVLAAIC